MARQFIDSGRDGAEWSEGHMPLGFRICTYNHESKGGPAHVHDRFNAVVGTLPALTKPVAARIVRRYVDRHDWFDIDLLAAFVDEVLEDGTAHRDPPDRQRDP